MFKLFLFQEVKVTSPDYEGMNKDSAVQDFKKRIKHYEESYEPIDEKADKNLTFIKIYNQGEKYLVNKVAGRITRCKITLYV
jgi:hypothetical protein